MMIPRAIDRNGSIAPMSSLVRTHALDGVDQDRRRVLTDTEMHRREAALLTRWIEGVFTDRQDARRAAIEGARQRTYAHDLEQASEEVRALAFPEPEPVPETEPELQTYPDTRNDDLAGGCARRDLDETARRIRRAGVWHESYPCGCNEAHASEHRRVACTGLL